MIKYFPFAPGIPWNMKGPFLDPTLNVNIWGNILQNRNAVVVVHGGLIESFVSLIYLEIINHLAPNKKIYWYGDSKFHQLIWLNGLASICATEISPDILSKFPVPIFLDKKEFFYYNVLNNYLNIKTIRGTFSYKNKKPILEQLFKNTTLANWNISYIPQIRKNINFIELKAWAKINNFSFTQPYVCIFPDRGVSIHPESFLGLTITQIKSLAAILKQAGVTLICFTQDINKYHNSVYALPPKIDYILYMLPKAKTILSEEVDYLLLGGMVSNAKIIGKNYKHYLNLEKNMKFIERNNVIYSCKELNPTYLAKIILQK